MLRVKVEAKNGFLPEGTPKLCTIKAFKKICDYFEKYTF